MGKGIVAVVAVFALIGCSGASEEEPSSKPKQTEASSSPSKKSEPESTPTERSDEDNTSVYIKKVRANIPGAAAYDDDVFPNMADNVCSLGSVDLGVQVLDNYSAIEAEDRAELATIALDTASLRRARQTHHERTDAPVKSTS